MVTGEGADEVLGGYDIFREGRVREFWARDPGSANRDRAVELLYPWMARNPGTAPGLRARASSARTSTPTTPPCPTARGGTPRGAVKAMLTPDARGADARPRPATSSRAMPAGSDAWDPLARAQWLEMTTLLPGYILAIQGDRMLMANSVEGRFPFLDRDVVEFANRLPARHKLFGLDEKHLLKRAFADLVPEQIRRRPKQPYRAPDAASFFSGGDRRSG